MVKQSQIAFSRWQSLLQPFRVAPIAAYKLFFDLTAAYASTDRFYHNLAHIQQVLDTIDLMRSQSQNFAALEFAAWFHDVIYDPKAKDNEEKSAAYAADVLTNIGISAETIDNAVNLILTTKTHQAIENSIDSQIFLDADLSILGAFETEYRNYAVAIRQEYSWLSEGEYRSGRKQVLQNFLKRERIYFTEQMFTALEEKARQNIQEEIKYLSSGNSNKI
ncbi:hypothetical protein [Argonema antarcticum]|uniref:HD domain-containing protein n=1 Tax=Argonema antarcticum TaxID=2942763 RepID=UPI00201269FD|nr:hypothetical protein [Argonema antarcticum]MCL1472356.1 hypothetical protein [Argonema antarcticum A004/B2]